MNSVTHFHSKNVNFYIHYSDNLKGTAFNIFFFLNWVDIPPGFFFFFFLVHYNSISGLKIYRKSKF